jgi:NAD(P)-dependent dehydrogenase (short-subunit alcohol dehydrogenase family)
MTLVESRVLVVGGSSGIGLAVAQAASGAGAHVLIASRSSQKLEKAKSQMDCDVQAWPMDFSQEKSVIEFFRNVDSLDHLVVTASEELVGPFLELDPNIARRQFDSKYWVQYYAAKYGVPKLTDRGSITLFSGAASARLRPGYSSLASVNGAIEALGRALAVELAPKRVNVVSPSIIDTPVHTRLPDNERDAFFDSVADSLPVDRIGTPEDVAQSVLYCMSNGYTTGTVLHVDGGRRLV